MFRSNSHGGGHFDAGADPIGESAIPASIPDWSERAKSSDRSSGRSTADTIQSRDSVHTFNEAWDLASTMSSSARSEAPDEQFDDDQDGFDLLGHDELTIETNKPTCDSTSEVEVESTVRSPCEPISLVENSDVVSDCIVAAPGDDEDVSSSRCSTPASGSVSPNSARIVTDPTTTPFDEKESTLTAACDGPVDSSPSSECEARRIQVLVRVRPSTRKSADENPVVTVGEQATTLQLHLSGNHSSAGVSTVTECAFDRVFGVATTQETVFEAVEPSVRAAIDGYNATVFAYGQTGTGKTHTLFGKVFDVQETVATPPVDSLTESTATTSQTIKPMWGIVPRAIRLLLMEAARVEAAAPATENACIRLQCSFVQIYNDRLFDLLTDRRRQKPLLLREIPRVDGTTSVVVQGLSSERVESVLQALQLIRQGLDNRSVRETEANLASSRSHAIVQVHIVLERTLPTGERVTRTSRLNLVDLAGSEKWNTDISMDDAHSLELKNINASLSALGNCIAALAEPGRKHIPYRDSTLTRVLQDSLGGNTQSCLIATISPSQAASEETLRTLQFADRARSVMQTVHINEATADGSAMSTELVLAKAQISKLRERLESAQRRHSEVRAKELDACQRKHLEALQAKDREILKLSRDNAAFLKWKEEDARKIRELEGRVRELEVGDVDGQLSSSSPPVTGNARHSRLEEQSNNTPPGLGAAAPSSRSNKKTARQRGGSVEASNPSSEVSRATRKASLPRLSGDDGNRARGPRTYKQLLERYAVQSGSSKRVAASEDRGAFADSNSTPTDDDTPNQTETLPESEVESRPEVTAVSSGFSSIPQVPAASPRGVVDIKPEQRVADPLRQSLQTNQSQYPPLRDETDSLRSLLDKSAWRQSDIAGGSTLYTIPPPIRSVVASSVPMGSTGEASNIPGVMKSQILADWGVDVMGGSTPKPAVMSTSSQCAKHNLRGCVLCGTFDHSNKRLPVVGQTSSIVTGYPAEVTHLSPPNGSTSSDEPCARHRLARCFICCKSIDSPSGGSSITASSGSQPFRVSESESVTSTVAACWSSVRGDGNQAPLGGGYVGSTMVGMTAYAVPTKSTNLLKCTTHSLSNCVLCGTSSGIAPESKVGVGVSLTGVSGETPTRTSAVYSEYPPRRYTLDSRTLGLGSSMSTATITNPDDGSARLGALTSMHLASSSLSHLHQFSRDLPSVQSSSGFAKSVSVTDLTLSPLLRKAVPSVWGNANSG